jgi:YHS domain-containing protein
MTARRDRVRDVVLACALVTSVCACKGRSTAEAEPPPAAAASIAASPPALWESIDESFKGCEGECGARVTSNEAGVTAQPGAAMGDRTFCPVSGVVFEVKASSPHREVDGRTVYFCCETCAAYFSRNSERVIAARGWRR